MAFSIIQAGTSLQLVDDDGVVATLTLPTNIVLTASRKPRFAVFGRYVVMVNSPSRPISIDGDGVCRVLSPRPSALAPVLSAVAGGTLTGTYYVKSTFGIEDAAGNLIAESDFGPPSLPQAVTAEFLKVASLDNSPDSVSFKRLYRTTTGGAITGPYFSWLRIDGNTQSSVQDDLADAGLSLFAAPTLGNAPDLTLIAEFRGRLWGADRIDVDQVFYTEAGAMYAWAAGNKIPVPKVGADTRGLTALIPRREALGIGRRNVMRQVTGDRNANFGVVNLTENIGVESQETVCVHRDVARWLWKDGVYEWSSDGFKCISDGQGGRGNVRSWFVTDDYFNRAEFDNAFALMLPDRNVYRLFLCSAGSTTIDRFVDYDINERTWWGPHKTGAFTPTCAMTRPDSDDVLRPNVGSSSGFLWQEQATRSDGSAAVVMDLDTKRYDARTPTIEKYWGDGAIVQVAQAAAGALVMTPSVGGLEATPSTDNAQDLDCRESVQSLARIGTGQFLKLNFYEDTPGQNVKITGFEIPHHELGRRV